MSDDEPTITVTRGKRNKTSKRQGASSANQSRSSGLGLPGPGAVISGAVRGVRTAWWAGLGLVAAARDAGTQVFEALVEEGKSWEQTERKRREETAQRLAQLRDDEGDAVDTIEATLRSGVHTMLAQTGAARRSDVEEIQKRVDHLSRQVEQIADALDASSEGESPSSGEA